MQYNITKKLLPDFFVFCCYYLISQFITATLNYNQAYNKLLKKLHKTIKTNIPVLLFISPSHLLSDSSCVYYVNVNMRQILFILAQVIPDYNVYWLI